MRLSAWFRSLVGGSPTAKAPEYLSKALNDGQLNVILDAYDRGVYQFEVDAFQDFILRDDLIVETASMRLVALEKRLAINTTITLESAQAGQMQAVVLSIDRCNIPLTLNQMELVRNIAHSYWANRNMLSETKKTGPMNDVQDHQK